MYLLTYILLFFIICMSFQQLKKSNAIVASINGLWWSFFILGGVLFFDTRTWNFAGLIYILITCLFVFLGEYFGAGLAKHGKFSKQNMYSLYADNSKKELGNFVWIMQVCFIVLGFFRCVMVIRGHGYSISNFTNMDSYLEMNSQMAYDRYYGDNAGNGTMAQILLIFCYLAPLSGGYMFLYTKTLLQKGICCAGLFPIILNMLFENTKAGFIASIFLFGIGFIIAYLEKNRRFIRLQLKYILFILVAAFLMICVLMLVMCIRIGNISPATLEIVKKKFVVYAFGNIEAFVAWFDIRPQQTTLAFGSYTFLGIASKLGLQTREQGVYETLGGIASNVFTAFRGSISDYGILGSVLFYFVLGLLGGICIRNISNKRNSLSKTVLASILFYMFYSFIISPWTYISFILVFPCFYVFLLLSRYSIKLKW